MVDAEPPRRAYVEMIMGLPFSVHIRGVIDVAAESAAVQSVWRELRRLDRIFSTYRTNSDISRIDRGELSAGDADPLVAEVLQVAEQARVRTGGAFDVRYAGHLDANGIVKGWAAVRAAVHLNRLGADFYLGAGGDVLLRSPATRAAWRVGIEHPADAGGLLTVLQIADGAVATSGRAHRGGHIVDPATGGPATSVVQATVCGPDLMWADVYATAMVVSPGPVRGTWNLPPGYEFLLVADGGEVTASAGMARLLAPDRPESRARVPESQHARNRAAGGDGR